MYFDGALIMAPIMANYAQFFFEGFCTFDGALIMVLFNAMKFPVHFLDA